MTTGEHLRRGRDAFERRAWGDAYGELSVAQETSPLEPEDVERLAIAGYLTGRDDECADLLDRAHHGFLDGRKVTRAFAAPSGWGSCC